MEVGFLPHPIFRSKTLDFSRFFFFLEYFYTRFNLVRLLRLNNMWSPFEKMYDDGNRKGVWQYFKNDVTSWDISNIIIVVWNVISDEDFRFSILLKFLKDNSEETAITQELEGILLFIHVLIFKIMVLVLLKPWK